MVAAGSALPAPREPAVLIRDDQPGGAGRAPEQREFRYTGSAATFHEQEPIAQVAARLGWTVAGMRQDWAGVFPAAVPSWAD